MSQYTEADQSIDTIDPSFLVNPTWLVTQPVTQVFLINTSRDVTDRGGDIVISVTRTDGSSKPVELPLSFLPVDATSFVPFKELLEAPKFLDAYRNGLVKIVTKEYADALFADPRANAELARMRQRKESVRQAMSNNSVLGKNTTITGGRDDAEEAQQALPKLANSANTVNGVPRNTSGLFKQQAQSQQDTAKPGLSTDGLFGVPTAFIAWVNQLNVKPYEEAVLAIQNRGSLTMDELVYLHEHTNNARIKAVLATKLPV